MIPLSGVECQAMSGFQVSVPDGLVASGGAFNVR